MKALGIALFLVVGAASSEAVAYPFMIRHEYTSCAQCHADPSGGGLLTEYGRAQGEILLRTRYGKKTEEEEPGRVKDFLFGVPLPAEVSLGGDIRAMYLRTQAGSAPATGRAFPMQADVVGQIAGGRLRINASLGYAKGSGALPASLTSGDSRLISRHHWVGLSLFDEQVLVRAGRMNLPFGLRNLEHTTWVRSATRTDINESQQHGLAVSLNLEGWRGEVMGIVGNLQLEPAVFRERGYSAYLERAFSPHAAFGVSSRITHAERDLLTSLPTWRHAHGVFGRVSPTPLLVLLAEVDALVTSAQGQQRGMGVAGMLQADLEPIQGLHLIGTSEVLASEIGREAPGYGIWGGAQWFFAPHMDLRADVVWRSLPAVTGPRESALAVMVQYHLFL